MTRPKKADPPCSYNMRRGWWCSRLKNHNGPCALRPKWWNVSRFARKVRNGGHC